jgi:hypothetical protein
VISLPRLVINDRDTASLDVGAAKLLLCSCIRVAIRGNPYIERLTLTRLWPSGRVTGLTDLIERALVRAPQKPHCTVSCDARMTFRFKNIAGEIGCGNGSVAVAVAVAARTSPCHGRRLADVEGLSDTRRRKKSHQ